MPQNCSNDVQAVIAHVDKVLTTGSPSEIEKLKANWGLEALPHVEDVANARAYRVYPSDAAKLTVQIT